MTVKEKALRYFKNLREQKVEDYSMVLDVAPKDSVVYETVLAELEIYDTVIKALEQEPCKDAVSRKDIYFKLTNGAYPNETIEQFIDRLVKELEASPSVTLQPKIAQWISKGDVYPAWRYCSNCGEPWTFDCGTPNFCPVCGAKMKKEE